MREIQEFRQDYTAPGPGGRGVSEQVLQETNELALQSEIASSIEDGDAAPPGPGGQASSEQFLRETSDLAVRSRAAEQTDAFDPSDLQVDTDGDALDVRVTDEAVREQVADQTSGIDAEDVQVTRTDDGGTEVNIPEEARRDRIRQQVAEDEGVDPEAVSVERSGETPVSGGDARLLSEAGTDGSNITTPVYDIEIDRTPAGSDTGSFDDSLSMENAAGGNGVMTEEQMAGTTRSTRTDVVPDEMARDEGVFSDRLNELNPNAGQDATDLTANALGSIVESTGGTVEQSLPRIASERAAAEQASDLASGGLLSSEQETAIRRNNPLTDLSQDIRQGGGSDAGTVENLARGGAAGLVSLANVPEHVVTADTAASVAVDTPGQFIEDPTATTQAYTDVGSDIAESEYDRFKQNPAQTTGSLTAQLAVGGAIGRAASGTRLNTGRTGQVFRATADPGFTAVRAVRRRTGNDGALTRRGSQTGSNPDPSGAATQRAPEIETDIGTASDGTIFDGVSEAARARYRAFEGESSDVTAFDVDESITTTSSPDTPTSGTVADVGDSAFVSRSQRGDPVSEGEQLVEARPPSESIPDAGDSPFETPPRSQRATSGPDESTPSSTGGEVPVPGTPTEVGGRGVGSVLEGTDVDAGNLERAGGAGRRRSESGATPAPSQRESGSNDLPMFSDLREAGGVRRYLDVQRQRAAEADVEPRVGAGLVPPRVDAPSTQEVLDRPSRGATYEPESSPSFADVRQDALTQTQDQLRSQAQRERAGQPTGIDPEQTPYGETRGPTMDPRPGEVTFDQPAVTRAQTSVDTGTASGRGILGGMTGAALAGQQQRQRPPEQEQDERGSDTVVIGGDGDADLVASGGQMYDLNERLDTTMRNLLFQYPARRGGVAPGGDDPNGTPGTGAGMPGDDRDDTADGDGVGTRDRFTLGGTGGVLQGQGGGYTRDVTQTGQDALDGGPVSRQDGTTRAPDTTTAGPTGSTGTVTDGQQTGIGGGATDQTPDVITTPGQDTQPDQQQEPGQDTEQQPGQQPRAGLGTTPEVGTTPATDTPQTPFLTTPRRDTPFPPSRTPGPGPEPDPSTDPDPDPDPRPRPGFNLPGKAGRAGSDSQSESDSEDNIWETGFADSLELADDIFGGSGSRWF
ncbi:hypothetical protein [Halostella litorea]|uniref:hypothetical protein n=1 Tax=Halostella litorea TaxID=2528831 RepID=UPI0010919371|nr:hypothetical protein [Halostella litorea]